MTQKSVFKQISMSDTYVSTSIFKGLFKNLVFRSVKATVTKKLWAILVFLYTDRTSYRLYPTP